jgi:hypothetical protein
MFSPKIEIINHFDNLINGIDIDIDSSLEKYNDQQLLSEQLKSTEKKRRNFMDEFKVKLFQTVDSSKQELDSWSESTKVVNYLNQVRMKTINELRKAQEDALEYYMLNSSHFKSEEKEKNLFDQQQRQLFADRNSYFQIHCTKKRLWAFDVFTFETDFYMSTSEINLLE